MSALVTFFQRLKLERILDKHPRLGPLPDEIVDAFNGGRTEDVIVKAQDRMRAFLVDDVFVTHGCYRALEMHPRLPVLEPSMLYRMVERGEMESVLAWAQERHQEIELEERDPYNYGWRGDPKGTRALGGGWKKVVDSIEQIRKADPLAVPKILLMGGNRSGKSTFAGWYASQLMASRPNMKVGILCPSQAQAREVMMERLFRYLPPEWKPEETGKANSGFKGRISYNLKTGFTDDKFSLPNGSTAQFFFYLDGDVKAIEGYEFDLLLADEEVPVEWLETAAFRMTSRQGIIIAMFTPISGYGPTVEWFKGNGKALEEREAEMLPRPEGVEGSGTGNIRYGPNGYELLPVVERGASADKRVIYFWSEDNLYPMNSYKAMRRELLNKRATRNVIKTRAYGVPTKVKDAAFPRFNPSVHCLSLAEVPKEVTWYHVMDPAHGRNSVMQWWAVDRLGREICVREWPQQDDYIPGVGRPGAWATISTQKRKLDGEKGEAQESWGLSYDQMKDEIDRIEKELAQAVEKREDPDAKIKVIRRVLDSRLGSAETHGTTIQKEYAKRGIYFDFASGKNLNITSADNEATAGITLINNSLSYDDSKPLGPLNHPKLMVVYEEAETENGTPKGCANTVFSLSTWTGADKEHGACKDFVDTTHYFLREEPRFFEPVKENLFARGSDSWGGY